MRENDKRDSFIFYRSFFEASKPLKKNEKAELFEAICNYALNQKEVELKPLPKAMFALIHPQLDANYKKYLNGKKPKEKTSKTVANDKQTVSKTEGNVNGNVNGNENENVNDNNNVPSEAVFIAYASEQAHRVGLDLDLIKTKLKYISWVENDWKTGGDISKQIKNWKVTLNNTLVYLKKDVKPEDKPFIYDY